MQEVKAMQYLKYKESKSHGTSEFPVGYYYVNHLHPQYTMPYHWHEELEFIHIIEGEFEVTIDENSRLARPGDILIVNSGCLHGGIPHDCTYECIVIPCSILLGKSFASPFLDKLNRCELRLDEYYPYDPNKIYSLMEEFFRIIRGITVKQELIAIGLLNQIIGYIYSENRYVIPDQAERSKHKNIYLLKNVLDYIDHNYSNKIELNDLARITGMSPKYFCRFFFEMTSRTPIDYVNYYRIERACYQLITTNDSITEISLSCGFNDISYFIKTFKKYKGKSPKQYIKELIP